MTNANRDIRNVAKQSGVFLWELARYLKISEPTMTRKLRFELSEGDKIKYMKAIKAISDARGEDMK